MDPEDYAGSPPSTTTPRLRKWNLWGYIDAPRRRAGGAAAPWSADCTGVEVFIIANADTVMTRPSAELPPRSSPACR